jgi:hypothetical protein
MRWLAFALCLVACGALAAPADDGQTAGSRVWTLNQARSAVAITPSDSTDLTIKPTRAIYIGDGSACNVAVRMADDGTTATTFASVQPGTLLPIQVNRVMSSSTTCASIIGLY